VFWNFRGGEGATRTHSGPFTYIQNFSLPPSGFGRGSEGALLDLFHHSGTQILVETKSWMVPNPGFCHILETVTSWKIPDPVNVKSWRMPNPGDCHILVAATSLRLTHPGKCLILGNTKSWRMPNPGKWQMLEYATSRHMPHPGNFHILENAKFWKIPHVGS